MHVHGDHQKIVTGLVKLDYLKEVVNVVRPELGKELYKIESMRIYTGLRQPAQKISDSKSSAGCNAELLSGMQLCLLHTDLLHNKHYHLQY